MPRNSRNIVINLIAFALLAVGISLLYANTLQSPFYFDDKPNIVLNPYLRIESPSWENLKLAAIKSPNGRRWLPNISFALNHYFDGYDVWGYHLVNIITHIASSFVFFLLAKTTLALPSLRNLNKNAGEIALGAALLWALHPLQTNAVTYIVQRMTAMGALFYLAALYCYVKARIQKSSWVKISLFGATLLLGLMSLFSKENGGMLPIIIIAYEIFFLRQQLHTRIANQKKLILLVGCALLIFLCISIYFLGSNPFAVILKPFVTREYTLEQRLLSETRIIIHYLTLLFLPLPSRLNLMYEYQLSYGLLTPPQTLLALSGLAAMGYMIFATFQKYRLVSFGLLWFLVNLFIESSFIPLELVYEHRMYVPSMFIILAFVAWGYKLGCNRIFLIRASFFVLCLLLAYGTWQRNSVWGNSISLWEDVASKSPNTMRAWGNLGNAYGDAKKYKLAEKYLLRALELETIDKSGNFSDEALKNYTSNIHDNLALIYRELNQDQKAIKHAERALVINPGRPNPFVTLGIIYSKNGQHIKANEYFLLAWVRGIESVDLFNNWAVSLFSLGKVDEAINLLQKALQIDPDHAESHYNLGIAYSSKGMLQEAQREMLRAMQLRQKR